MILHGINGINGRVVLNNVILAQGTMTVNVQEVILGEGSTNQQQLHNMAENGIAVATDMCQKIAIPLIAVVRIFKYIRKELGFLNLA